MLRNKLLKIAIPITKFIGKIHFPFTHKWIKGEHYNAVKTYLKDGDILLSRTRGEFSNLFIPGFWSHAAIYFESDGDRYVVEAVGSGVRIITLIEFLLTKDYVAGYRSLFTDERIALNAVNICKTVVRSKYDYQFDFKMDEDNAFSCIELALYGYRKLLGEKMEFKPEITFGEEAYTPDMVANSPQFWTNIFKI